jgi:hypothetical protein
MHVASHSPLVSLIYATVVGGLVYLTALFTLDVAEIRGNAAGCASPKCLTDRSIIKRLA